MKKKTKEPMVKTSHFRSGRELSDYVQRRKAAEKRRQLEPEYLVIYESKGEIISEAVIHAKNLNKAKAKAQLNKPKRKGRRISTKVYRRK
jgi:hypothetical protein